MEVACSGSLCALHQEPPTKQTVSLLCHKKHMAPKGKGFEPSPLCRFYNTSFQRNQKKKRCCCERSWLKEHCTQTYKEHGLAAAPCKMHIAFCAYPNPGHSKWATACGELALTEFSLPLGMSTARLTEALSVWLLYLTALCQVLQCS